MSKLCYNTEAKLYRMGEVFYFLPVCFKITNVAFYRSELPFCAKNRTQDKVKNLAICVASHLAESWVRFFAFIGDVMKKRDTAYNGKVTWERMVALYGHLCAYCREEPAVTIDHIIPWSYSYDSSLSNLCPCCLWCNLHAGDKYFSSFEDKQRFLRDKRCRGRSASSRTVCVTCFLPYQRPHMTSSMFQCPLCDPSKATGNQLVEWGKFEHVLETSGVRLHLHTIARKHMQKNPYCGARQQLGELYVAAVLDDEDLAEKLNYWRIAKV